jgi:uncharacterized membrane protein YeaQ/YmgE (transglycosylase-associated protein family)
MEFLYFLLLGAISGWLAGQFWKGSGFGLIGNIIVGIIGAIFGVLVSWKIRNWRWWFVSSNIDCCLWCLGSTVPN